MDRKAFTIIEIIFVLVVIGILAAVAMPRYFLIGKKAHEKTLNRTTGEDLWARSISEGKNGSIKNLADNEDYQFLSQYISIPPEINKSDINLSKCGVGEYKTVMTANSNVAEGEYNITCKDGTAKSAPYFRLIRVEDRKILVSR